MFNFLKSAPAAPLFLGQNDKAIMHLGTDTKGRPICVDSPTTRSHILVTGSTGSGKTEMLLGLMTNAFAWGSGGVFVDGKGDVSLFARMYAIAEYFGRKDDLYVLNFMMSENLQPVHRGGRSHRFNPFAKGSADTLTQLIETIIDDPDAPFWKGRASAMITAVLRVLCWQRDELGHSLDASTIWNSLSLRCLIDMATSDAYGDVPRDIKRGVTGYLQSIPGFETARGYSQSQTTRDYHGFTEMQLTKMLSTLCDVYGHIFNAGQGDIDLEDIIRNRRFLLVMLPALEKSHDEIARLGRIVVASLKVMASTLLSGDHGGSLDGSYGDDAETKEGRSPFLCIFDEASHYMVRGVEQLANQARSLGIGMVFASQDMHSLFHANHAVARAIVANTKTKIAMSSCDWAPEMEAMFANARPGRDDVIKSITRAGGHGNLGRVVPSLSSMVSHFGAGEFALISSGKMIIGRGIYVDVRPRKDSYLRITRFRSVSAAANDILKLEGESTNASCGDVLEPVPTHLQALCEQGDKRMHAGGTELLAAALAALSDKPPEAPVTDIVRLGE
jgi:hypothetical protein